AADGPGRRSSPGWGRCITPAAAAPTPQRLVTVDDRAGDASPVPGPVLMTQRHPLRGLSGPAGRWLVWDGLAPHARPPPCGVGPMTTEEVSRICFAQVSMPADGWQWGWP